MRPASGVSLPTGLSALDAALGTGGLPRGRVAELSGPPSCGKTTLALQAVAHAQKSGMAAGWIDADRTFELGYAAALGVAVERLAVIRPMTAEDALEMARRLAATAALDVLVIDSAAALVPRLELEAGVGLSGPSLQARVLAAGLRRLVAETARAGCVTLFVNQIRGRRDTSGEECETSAGGPALKLHASVRIRLSPAHESSVHFRILKNKVAEAFAEGELLWTDGMGFTETP